MMKKIQTIVMVIIMAILMMVQSVLANPIQDAVAQINDRIDVINDIALQSQKNIDDGYKILEYRADKASRFFGQATAGAMATSSIDFGSVSKGETEVGLGAGVSSSYISTVYAGAVAVKHGITDKNAIIVKGWKSDGSSYSVGVGTTYKFGD